MVQSTTPEFHRIPRLANMAMSKQDTVFQNHRYLAENVGVSENGEPSDLGLPFYFRSNKPMKT